MPVRSAAESSCQGGHEIVLSNKRKWTAVDGLSSAADWHKRRKTGLSCDHWLHKIPKVYLESDALKHLADCIELTAPKPADTKEQRRPQTRAYRKGLQRKEASSAARLSQPGIPFTGSPASRDIKRFARQGGPDLSDLRGYQILIPSRALTMESRGSRRGGSRGSRGSMSRTSSSATSHRRQLSETAPTANTKTTSSSGAYRANFESHMRQSGIYPAGTLLANGQPQPEPDNYESLQKILQQPRASMSPSRFTQEDFKLFQQTQYGASDLETKVTRTVIPYIQGPYVDSECIAEGMPFNNTGNMLKYGNSYIPRPDLYYGTRPEQLDVCVRNELGSYIAPSTIGSRPIAPNYFVETKSTSGSGKVARNQLGMSGATGVRAMHKLQTHGSDVDTYDNNAYVLSAHYIDGTMNMYSHYAAQPGGPSTAPEYYMHTLNGYSLTGNRSTAAEGITAFRNAKDWTDKQRKEMIARANAAARAVAEDANADIDAAADDQDHAVEQGMTGHSGYEQSYSATDSIEVDYDDTRPEPHSFTESNSHFADARSAGKRRAVIHESSLSPDELAEDMPRPRRAPHRKKNRPTRDGLAN